MWLTAYPITECTYLEKVIKSVKARLNTCWGAIGARWKVDLRVSIRVGNCQSISECKDRTATETKRGLKRGVVERWRGSRRPGWGVFWGRQFSFLCWGENRGRWKGRDTIKIGNWSWSRLARRRTATPTHGVSESYCSKGLTRRLISYMFLFENKFLKTTWKLSFQFKYFYLEKRGAWVLKQLETCYNNFVL